MISVIEMLTLVGPVFVIFGLARAGVLSWQMLPWLVAGAIGPFLLPFDQPILFAVVILVGLGPLAAIGLRLVQRHRADAAAQASRTS